MNDNIHNNRWYDQDRKLSSAVNLIVKFPFEFQSIICDGICMLAESEFRANELINEFKSVGSDKVLALYKSKQRKRDYDDNPHTHKALNYLYFLSPKNRYVMADHIISMVDLVQSYLKTCLEHSEQPQHKNVKSLTSTYVVQGKASANSLLQNIQKEFIERLQKPSTPPEKPKRSGMEKIEDEGTDMRITGDN